MQLMAVQNGMMFLLSKGLIFRFCFLGGIDAVAVFEVAKAGEAEDVEGSFAFFFLVDEGVGEERLEFFDIFYQVFEAFEVGGVGDQVEHAFYGFGFFVGPCDQVGFGGVLSIVLGERQFV